MTTALKPVEIYLTDSSDSSNWLHLPVNPEEFRVSSEKQIETYNIIDLGEVDFPTGDKRAEISFSSFFPALYDASYCRYAELHTPQSIVEWILDLQSKGKPIWLLITGSPVNTLTLLSRFEYRSKGGEPGDVYYDMSFRSWVDIKVRLKERTKTVGRTRADLKAVPPIVKVPGKIVDSADAEKYLAKVAKMELGDMALWRQLLNLNLPMITKNAYKIVPYMKLVMPQ